MTTKVNRKEKFTYLEDTSEFDNGWKFEENMHKKLMKEYEESPDPDDWYREHGHHHDDYDDYDYYDDSDDGYDDYRDDDELHQYHEDRWKDDFYEDRWDEMDDFSHRVTHNQKQEPDKALDPALLDKVRRLELRTQQKLKNAEVKIQRGKQTEEDLKPFRRKQPNGKLQPSSIIGGRNQYSKSLKFDPDKGCVWDNDDVYKQISKEEKRLEEKQFYSLYGPFKDEETENKARSLFNKMHKIRSSVRDDLEDAKLALKNCEHYETRIVSVMRSKNMKHKQEAKEKRRQRNSDKKVSNPFCVNL